MITYTSVFIEYSKKGIKAMKKNNVKKTGRIVRSCFAAMLAVVMAVPVAALTNIVTAPVSEPVEVEAADVELPEPIMTLDFERGFKGEALKNGLKVKESKERLMFEEYKDDKDAYIKDENGEYIFKWTDEPVIFGTEEDPKYQKGTFGNQPTTYDDAEKGNVFRLDDSMEAEWIIKTKSDKADKVVPVYTGGFDETTGEPLDKEAAEKSTLQIAHTAHSAVQIKNPFVDIDFTEEYDNTTEEGPQWTKGVTISYWVKVPTVEPKEGEEVDEEEILNDSVLFTFENIQRPEDVDQYKDLDPNGEKVVYEVNGYIKYKAAVAYDPADPMYAQGTLSELVDMNTGEKFEVLSDYGPLVRLTPDYPGTPDRKIYFRDDADTKAPDKTVSVFENGKVVQAKLYELGANIYDDYKTLNTDEGSLVPRGYINGSMQISASNAFHFKEDDFYQKVEIDENGNDVTTPIKGAYDINPNNKDEIGKFRQFRYYNLFYFQGDGTVTEEADQWHYVTCVIQNDWVQFYVDGEEIEADSLSYHGTPFNSLNGKKYFNKGFGIRYPYQIGWTNVAEWIDDGTFSSGPSNCEAQTMLEWISNPDTVLYLGYEGICAESVEQNIGTLDGAMLDDIKFYDVPLTSEEATVLYEQALAEKDEQSKKAPTPFKVFDFESESLNALPSGMTALSTNEESTRTPKVVNDEKFGHVFKFGEGKSSKTSAVSFENPFKGMNDLEGATVSYWVKTIANEKGKVGDGVVLSFIDEPKVLEHGKIQEAVKDVESRTGLWSNLSYDAEFRAGLDTKVYESLKNSYQQSTKKNGNTKKGEAGYDEEADKLEDEWTARVESMTEWHHVTMVIENSGIYMYMDGVKLPNNLEDDMGPMFYGPRFYDGYYNTMLDSFSSIRLGTGNQTATSVMEFLTQEDTTAYFGFVYNYGSKTTYKASALTLVDDMAFYDKALSEEEVATIYSDAVAASSSKSAVAGEEIYKPYGDTATEAPVPTNPPIDVKEETDFTDTTDGKRTATANGVTVTGDKASIPDNAKLVVNKLGETSSKANYEAAEKALKGASIAIDSYNRVLYDIHIEVDGKTVAPTGKLTVTLTPPTGYQAAKVSIVRMSDVKSMTTSVSGSSVKYETESLGEFAVIQKKGVTGENPSTSGSSTAGKTGDTASVVVPVMLLAVAFVVVAALRRKEELMED